MCSCEKKIERDKERWRLSCERQLRRKKKRCCKERWRQQLASEPCRSEATTAARPTPCEVEDGGARWVAVGGAMLPVAGCGVMPLDDGGAKLPQDDGVTPMGGTTARGRYEEKTAWRSAPRRRRPREDMAVACGKRSWYSAPRQRRPRQDGARWALLAARWR